MVPNKNLSERCPPLPVRNNYWQQKSYYYALHYWRPSKTCFPNSHARKSFYPRNNGLLSLYGQWKCCVNEEDQRQIYCSLLMTVWSHDYTNDSQWGVPYSLFIYSEVIFFLFNLFPHFHLNIWVHLQKPWNPLENKTGMKEKKLTWDVHFLLFLEER